MEAMDCRKFHKDLEDYLEEGLDFSGRFGIERHAQQCIRCGKDLSEAQQLRHMVRQLERAKAPANFELSILSEIGKHKEQGLFSGFRRSWIYGFELPPARKLAWGFSCLAVLAIGFFYFYPYLSNRIATETVSAPPSVVREPAKANPIQVPSPVVSTTVAQSSRPAAPEIPRVKLKKAPEPIDLEAEQMMDQEVNESDYVEFQVVGPDNRPVSVRWPNKKYVRYGQTPEEYFIRNVSH
jgi:hypothetical protein